MAKKRNTVWNPAKSPVENARSVLPDLAARYLAAGRKLTAAEVTPEALHQFRLATKRFRYTLELFRPCYPPGLELRLAALRRISLCLGEINDYVTTRGLLLAKPDLQPEELAQVLKLSDSQTAVKQADFVRLLRTGLLAAGRERWWTDYLARFARRRGTRPRRRIRRKSAKRVLFVCVENSNRSQMAEAFARIHGAGVVEPYSAGSRPSGEINLQAIQSMRELGYELTRHRSKSLTEIPDIQYDVVMTMGCGDECPSVRAKRREDWNIPDPRALPPDEFRATRDLIEARVQDLLSAVA